MKLPKISLPLFVSSLIIVCLLVFGIGLLLLTPPTEKQDETETTDFAPVYSNVMLHFFRKEYSKHPNENVQYGTLQVIKPLVLLSNGATQRTKDQIDMALDAYSVDMDTRNAATNNLILNLIGLDGIEYKNNFAMWFQNDAVIKPSFDDINQTYFGGDISKLTLRDTSYADKYSTWIKQNLQSDNVDVSTILSTNPIIDILTIDELETALPVDKTTQHTFYGINEYQSMFMQLAKDDVKYYENSTLSVITLYLTDDERFLMTILVPTGNMSELIQLITSETLTEWQNRATTATGTIEIPIIDVLTTNETSESHRDMGMNDLFNGTASLDNMVSNNAFISAIAHISKLHITSDEAKLDADVDYPILFSVNKPFFYTIEDTSNSLITHVGSVFNPNNIDSENKTSENNGTISE